MTSGTLTKASGSPRPPCSMALPRDDNGGKGDSDRGRGDKECNDVRHATATAVRRAAATGTDLKPANGSPTNVKSTSDRCAGADDADRSATKLSSNDGDGSCGSSDGDTRFGLGRYQPDWMQRLSAPGSFLSFLCWFAFVQSFPVNGLTNVNTTTFERRFRLSSTQVGFISSAYDIVGGLVVLPISYYGGRGHKPRYLAVASLFIVAGCLVMVLPHVLAGRYRYGGGSSSSSSGSELPAAATLAAASSPWPSPSPWSEVTVGSARTVQAADGSLCRSSSNGTGQLAGRDRCRDEDDYSSGSQDDRFFYVFLFGMGLIGCGGITLYTVGTVFVDENVPADRSSLFTGIFFGFTSLGSAAGFLAGSRFLTIYVDAPATPPTQLTQEDPQWVGAWWMGYAINIGLAAFLSLFLFGFPRELPSAREARKTRVSEAHHHDSETHNRAVTDPTFGASIRDAPAATALLLRNPAFMCITLAGVVDSLVKSGIAQFLAKFIQNQFNQTASWSAMLAGFIVVPGAAGGCVAGGWLPRRLGLRVSGLIMLCLLSSIAVAGLSASVWMRCDVDIIAGVTAPYGRRSLSQNGYVETIEVAASGDDASGSTGDGLLSSPCNERCQCNTAAYEPVCGSDGLQYFSACHAGCAANGPQAGSLVNCSCVSASFATNASAADRLAGSGSVVAAIVEGRASFGKCRVTCPQLYGFLFLMFLAIFAVFVTLTPWTTMSMRVVPESQRTYAVGFQWVFVRLAGLAPGPVTFGAIIDAACVVWQSKCSGNGSEDGAAIGRGSCWLYRGGDMSTNVFAAMVSLKFASIVLYACAYKLYRPPPEGRAAAETAAAEAPLGSTAVMPLTSDEACAWNDAGDDGALQSSA